MSIYNLPPLTQTPEQTSGEVTNVFEAAELLGRESIGRVVEKPSIDSGADILYFPTHESLQAAITYIRSVELAEVDREEDEIRAALARIDTELAIQHDRLLAIRSYIDDLGLADDAGVADKKFNGYSQTDTVRFIQALEQARNITCGILEDLTEERRIVIANLEEIEQKDFELLQVGR